MDMMDEPSTQEADNSAQTVSTEEAAREASLRAVTAQNTAANGPPSRTHLRGGCCEPDPLDPDRVPCNNKVEHEDRQGISHFFGRNKRATSTVPPSCYPLLCRKHYQDRKYRMKDMPGHEAGQQCDAIAITLKRMSDLTWTDGKGNTWPRWSGFELQLCHTQSTGENEEEQQQSNDDEDGTPAAPKTAKKKRSTVTFTPDTKTQADQDGKPKRKQRIKAAPVPLPEWLQKVCSAEKQNQVGKFNPIGDRGGARYNFEDMAKIVRHIKSYCIDNNVRLPAVEALPVTAGLQAEADLKAAKKAIEKPMKDYNKARTWLADAQMKSRNTRRLQEDVMSKEAELKKAKAVLEQAKNMLEATKETLPERRVPRKRAEKGESATPAPEAEDDEESGKEETPVEEHLLDDVVPPERRGTLRQTPSKAVSAPVETAAEEIDDPMEIDEEEFPMRRKRALPAHLIKKAGVAVDTAGRPANADFKGTAEFVVPSPMRKLYLTNKKKKQPPVSASSTSATSVKPPAAATPAAAIPTQSTIAVTTSPAPATHPSAPGPRPIPFALINSPVSPPGFTMSNPPPRLPPGTHAHPTGLSYSAHTTHPIPQHTTTTPINLPPGYTMHSPFPHLHPGTHAHYTSLPYAAHPATPRRWHIAPAAAAAAAPEVLSIESSEDEDEDDEVVVTAVVEKGKAKVESKGKGMVKRKRVPPRLAPGVAVESDTDSDGV